MPSGPAGAPTAFAIASGGNGICHCHHVTELIGTVAGHGARITALELARGRAPLIGSADRAQPDAHPGGVPTPHMTGHVESPDTYMWSLDGPLQEDTLGLFNGEKFDRPVFDDKVAKDAEMQYDGLKGGVAWKETVSTHFIGKCPALIEILKWVEGPNLDKVTTEHFANVTSTS